MARAFGLIFLIFCGFMASQGMGDKSEDLEVNPSGVLVREADETEHSVSIAAEPSSESMEEAQGAEAPAVRRLGPSGKESKHHSDKSVAGGGVIIGGLVTAIFAAVFCYIRVTRKRGGVY